MRDFFKNQYVLHSLGAIAVIVVLVAGFLGLPGIGIMALLEVLSM